MQKEKKVLLNKLEALMFALYYLTGFLIKQFSVKLNPKHKENYKFTHRNALCKIQKWFNFFRIATETTKTKLIRKTLRITNHFLTKKIFTAKISRVTHNKMSNQSAVNHAIRQKRNPASYFFSELFILCISN